MEESTQKGFGSVVSLLPGRVIVLQAQPGTPSARSGLSPGDEILAINGYEISRLDLEQLTQLLSQSRQQAAQLIVRLPGIVRMLTFTLIPEEMQASSVERAFFIGAGIGYIRVASFDANTAAEIKKAIEKLGGDAPRWAGPGPPQQSRRDGEGRLGHRILVSAAGHEDLQPYYVIAHYSLSTALLQKGEPDAAISHCRAALSIQPKHAEARINLAVALDQKGQIADAIVNYEKALTISPKSIPAQNNLAWLLATGSNASLRNGNKALELAQQADQLSSSANLIVRRTLAAAYAEIGQFAKAIEIAQGASRLAEAQGDSALAAAIQKEIAVYQAGLPYREAPN